MKDETGRWMKKPRHVVLRADRRFCAAVWSECASRDILMRLYAILFELSASSLHVGLRRLCNAVCSCVILALGRGLFTPKA